MAGPDSAALSLTQFARNAAFFTPGKTNTQHDAIFKAGDTQSSHDSRHTLALALRWGLPGIGKVNTGDWLNGGTFMQQVFIIMFNMNS